MERHRYFKVNTLSEEAQRIIRDGLERNRTTPQIRREIEQRTGERIPRWALQRYAPWYRAQKRQRQEIQDRVGAATETALRLGHEVTAGVQAELLDALHQAAREGQISGMGPYSAGKLALAFADSERKDRDMEMRHQKLELEQRRVEVLEQRLALIGAKARRAIQQAGDESGEAISPTEAIRDIFGVASEN